MTSPSQLTLQFQHRPALGRDDFLVAPCNEAAVAWLDRWPDWPGPALIVYGPAGSGKSHLAAVFCARSGAERIEAGPLSEAAAGQAGEGRGALLIEDVDARMGEPDAEEALFHLYNRAKEQGRQILLTGSAAPSRWPFGLADLASRIKAAAAVEIGAPDDALIAAVLVKQFADRQLAIDADVVAFLQARMERSFAALRDTVDAIDRLSMAERRNITIPLVRKVLRTHAETREE